MLSPCGWQAAAENASCSVARVAAATLIRTAVGTATRIAAPIKWLGTNTPNVRCAKKQHSDGNDRGPSAAVSADGRCRTRLALTACFKSRGLTREPRGCTEFRVPLL